jgi:hypothetical protein
MLDLEEREEEGLDMVRLARVVAPGIPHHITQRGNRRQETFFCAEDYQEYVALTGELKGNSAERYAGESPGPRAAGVSRKEISQ